MFYERLEILLTKSGISSYKMAKDLGFSTSKVSAWKKNGSFPAAEALIKIADYFNVSLDYLVGRSDIPERR